MKLATKIVLALMIVLGLVSCVSLYPPPNKAFLQLESPPHRATIVLDAEDMTPEMVAFCMRTANRGEFKDYKFNESFNIGLNVAASASNIDTRSSTHEVSNQRSIIVDRNRNIPPDERGL